jgi:hypothetical protein
MIPTRAQIDEKFSFDMRCDRPQLYMRERSRRNVHAQRVTTVAEHPVQVREMSLDTPGMRPLQIHRP